MTATTGVMVVAVAEDGPGAAAGAPRRRAPPPPPAAPALDPLARLAKAHPAEPGFHPREKKGRLRRSRGEDADLTSAAVTSLADQADWVRPRRRWARTIGVLALLAMVGGLVYIAVRIGTSEIGRAHV